MYAVGYNYPMKKAVAHTKNGKTENAGEPSQKEKILEIVQSGKADNVAEISGMLNISRMSVYRYVRALMQEKKISKTFNKLSPYSAQKSPAYSGGEAIEKCAVCQKRVTDERLAVSLQQKNGQAALFCCAHCAVMGVLHLIGDINLANSIMGRDFLYGNPLDLRNAFLLLKTDVIPCCSPPILVFARKDDAEKFKAGFGGDIRSFDEIISRMKF